MDKDKDKDEDLLRDYYLDIVYSAKNGFFLPTPKGECSDKWPHLDNNRIRDLAIYAAVHEWSYSDFQRRLYVTNWFLERDEKQESHEIFL